MHIGYCYNEQTIEERRGGCASAIRGEDRGRPVSIKVVRIHPTNGLEMCLTVRPFQPHWGKVFLIKLLVEFL